MSQKVTTPPAPDKILRVRAAAETLGVSRSTVWRYARMGKLSPIRLSERVTGFSSVAIQALIASAAK